MKVLLISSFFPEAHSFLPLGVYTVASIFQKLGHEVEILDPNFSTDQKFFEVSINKDIIGFSINSFSWPFARKKIHELKKRSFEGKIIVGGVHATHHFEKVLEFAPIDYVVIGEAEKSLPLLLAAIEKNQDPHDVFGIAYIKDGKVVGNPNSSLLNFVDEIPPLPAYDLMPNGLYDVSTMETSRGCFGSCTFCSIPHKKQWRGLSADLVVERFKYIANIVKGKTRTDGIFFSDDCFTTQRERSIQILQGLKKWDLNNYHLMIESRVKQLNDVELLSLLTEFPNAFIQVGIEAGYDEGLKRIRKGTVLEEITECTKLLWEFGLSHNTLYSFIIGFPWENEKEIIQTIKTAAYLKERYGVRVNIAWWFPIPSELTTKLFIDQSISEYYFNIDKWEEDIRVFLLTHPLINQKTFNRINTYIKIYGDIGLCISIN